MGSDSNFSWVNKVYKALKRVIYCQNIQVSPEQPPARSAEDRAVSLRWLIEFAKDVPETFTTRDMVYEMVIPATQQHLCRYIDLLPTKVIGRAHFFISHAWQCRFEDLVHALGAHFEGKLASDPTWDVFVWLDVFAIMQHPGCQQMYDLKSLNAVLMAAESTLLVLDANGTPLKRVWCLHEIHQTVKAKGVQALVLLAENVDYDSLQKIYYELDVANASATVFEDKQQILAEVEASVGVPQLNLLLKQSLLGSTRANAATLMEKNVVGLETAAFASQLRKCGRMLQMFGLHEESIPVTKRALEMRSKVQGPEHLDIITFTEDLAWCLREKGDYANAEPMYRQVLEMRVRILGQEHPHTISSLSNLASCLFSKGDLAAAEPMSRQALEMQTRVLGPTHSNTVSALNNLADCLNAMGRSSEAEPMFRQALAMRLTVLGPEHPKTIHATNNLALCLKAQGNTAAAEPMFRQALSMRTKVLGPEHPITIVYISNLAMCLQARGDTAEAEPLHRRALDLRLTVLGAEDFDTLVSIHNLAVCVKASGKFADAELIYCQALKMHITTLGPEHLETIVCLSNLAVCLHAMGDDAAAEPLYRQVLDLHNKLLGPEHHDSIESIKNLAACVKARGDIAAAEPLYRHAFELRLKVCGPGNPNTNKARNNLASCLAEKKHT